MSENEPFVFQRRVSLSDDELAALDGRCRPSIQKEVNLAKARLAAIARLPELPPALARFVADVVSEAGETGVVVFRADRIFMCELCRTHAGYVPFKSGPRKGRPNHKKPALLEARELRPGHRAGRWSVALGGCHDCILAAQPALVAALAEVAAELPEPLRAPGAPRWVKVAICHCTECSWIGSEIEMGDIPAVAQGRLLQCPQCSAPYGYGRRAVEATEEFIMVDLDAENVARGLAGRTLFAKAR